jgi:uncharacterized membrane protein (DUF2068 family)
MDAKASKLMHVNLITKTLLILVILNIAGDVLSAYWFLSEPSLGELSLYGGLIASFAGKDGAIMIASALLLSYAAVYAVASFGLFRKLKWAPFLIIAVSILNRALALAVFEPNYAWLIWSAWQIVIISLAFYLWRKT